MIHPSVSGAPNPHEASGEDLRAARTIRGGDRGDPGGVQPVRHGRLGHDRPEGAQGGDAVLGVRGEEPDDLPDDQRYRQGGMDWRYTYVMCCTVLYSSGGFSHNHLPNDDFTWEEADEEGARDATGAIIPG